MDVMAGIRPASRPLLAPFHGRRRAEPPRRGV